MDVAGNCPGSWAGLFALCSSVFFLHPVYAKIFREEKFSFSFRRIIPQKS